MNTQETSARLDRSFSKGAAEQENASPLPPGFDAHAYRTAWLAGQLAWVMGRSKNEVQDVCAAAQFHDIGKASLPTGLFEQSDALTPHQLRSIQTHPELGARILRFGTMCSHENRRVCIHAAMFHHERWDGEGYPSGLRGEEIPEIARLVAIVDVFDALMAARSYKQAWSHERCVDYIADRAGSHFDPRLAGVFVALASTFPSNWARQVMQSASDRQAQSVATDRAVHLPLHPNLIEIGELSVSDWSSQGFLGSTAMKC